ncbi:MULTISPECIES: (d)CMP kinase [unclassified Corynebacterium]|uniref:(d)CMP kinase n=1 Tax=unclassified Corynebacterium TaxID=2624378 RepID=UPI0021683A69|nr:MULTISPECIES: (d)CMP kinase [unclassified Corynebacterium]MCS4489398.1 (d)CMP kinase [Corynebacterium sp. ES2775-CONJ]MCS4491209.1 (d)CMP kinase [Corynebacterium sp. ES2715-CONJ3]
MANQLIIAVDGPSGAGKSTVCRLVAQRYHAHYLDTGAMYRVATLHILRLGIDPQDATAVATATTDLPLDVNEDPLATEVILGGEDVSEEIRGTAVTQAVSAVSSVKEVRDNLVGLQRDLALKAQRCVVDGRDIGTVVLPQAQVKIFLTASAEVRAQRRLDQELRSGREAEFDAILAAVQRRDELDSTRSLSPLVPAKDAHVVDSSHLSLNEVVAVVTELVDNTTAAKENTHDE